MKKGPQKKDIVIYQAGNGAIKLHGDYEKETIWATQAQIVDVFHIDQSVVSRHVRNIFKDNEVSKKSNMQKMHIAHSDKPITLYSLDVILAVGYRVNSSKAIRFRQWATKTLRQHIIDGYTINRARIAGNYDEFLKAVGAEVLRHTTNHSAFGRVLHTQSSFLHPGYRPDDLYKSDELKSFRPDRPGASFRRMDRLLQY